MKKNLAAKSGLLNLCVALALCICSLGLCLSVFADTGGSWSVVTSPDLGPLTSVTCVSSSDCWAVGQSSASAYQTLIEHWDGTSWQIFTPPDLNNTPYKNIITQGVACASVSDCWIVGSYSNDNTGGDTLTEHWDGSSWQVVTSPNVTSRTFNRLNSLTCVSSSDCWAVGDNSNASTLTEHWDGTSWSIIPSADAGTNWLTSVTCASSSDCWAVGIIQNYNYSPIIEHWNGSSWSLASGAPGTTTNFNFLQSVTCVSSTDCWAVGSNLPNDIYQTLIEHWDGSSWQIVTSPNVNGRFNFLNGVTCLSAANCSAVGYTTDTSNSNAVPLIEHWDGTAWSVFSSPSVANSSLASVTCISSTLQCWSVGSANTSSLTEEYSPPIIQVTVKPSLAGPTFSVDGNSYSSAQTFSWFSGTSHTIATSSPQSGGTGVQYVWRSWSDGGAISHTITPTANKTYTASFNKQYYLTMTTGAGGKVSPASAWKNSGSVVSITATPTNNSLVSYSFAGWAGTGTGSYTGTNNPASITMSGPITESASFVQNPVNVTVKTSIAGPSFSVDGTAYTSSQTFSWPPGSSHTIATTSPESGGTGTQYVWKSWSDKGTISHTVAPTQNTTDTATFTTQYFLTMSAGAGGTVTPVSGWKNSGAPVSITAKPATGYSFTSWGGTGTGSFSGTTNPASISMGGPISETATFTHN